MANIMFHWCEHLYLDKKYGWCIKQGTIRRDRDDWDFCPCCGKPRPEPEKLKELWEILSDEYIKAELRTHEQTWKAVAQVAEQWFNEQQKEK